MTLELRIVERVSTVPAEEWNALVRDDASPFVEHTWLDCLEEAGCVGEKSGWLPHHLVLYEDDKVVAAAPAYLKTNSEGEFIFDWSWADLASRLGLPYYPKLVLAVPFTPATGHRVLWHPSRDRAETVAIFGPKRCLYGSNFPIEKLWTDYASLIGAFRDAAAPLSAAAQKAIFHDTARRVYRL